MAIFASNLILGDSVYTLFISLQVRLIGYLGCVNVTRGKEATR